MDTFGKGLGSLIPSGSSPPHPASGHPLPAGEGRVRVLPPHDGDEGDVMKMLQVAPDRIDPNPRQPRTTFDPGKIQELTDSIEKHGILEPLLVTQKPDGRFELIAGERRLRSAKNLGLKTVPVVVRHADDLEKLELSLIENLQRHDLNAIEEAEGYRELIEAFGLTQEEAAKKVGKSRETISNMLRLLELPSVMQREIASGVLSIAHARFLLSIDNPKVREEMFRVIIEKGLTVRAAQEMAAPKTRKKLSGSKDPSVLADEARMREALNTKVQIEKRGKAGRIVVHFYSDEDYGEIVGKISSPA